MTQLLASILGLASFVCFILVLIRLGKAKGALHVILGILSCGLYPLIWGWINHSALGITKIMGIWTACIAIGIPLNVMNSMKAVGDMQKLMEQQQQQSAPQQ